MAVNLSRSLHSCAGAARQAGLDPALLDAPEARLPAGAVCELLENAAREAGLGGQAQCSLAWKVRQLIEFRLASGTCTAQAVARDMGMPLRTFYFQMHGEGASFAAILDGTRKERALRCLEGADCRLGDVSDLLGFSALSAFSRWFRQRFGCSASAWLAQRS